jgi:Domain of unknown function (DUF4168)
LDKYNHRSQDADLKSRKKIPGDKFQGFCDSLVEIEKLRSYQIDCLKRSLDVKKLPSKVDILDPALFPFLSPKVRAVIQAFPYQAGEIVRQHGLDSSEFDRLHQTVKTNPFFRWRVQQKTRESQGRP